MRLKRPEGLNIIPFIDIMLVLLAIVLTVATFVSQQSIKVAVPKATQGLSQTDKKKHQIVIKEDNTIFFNEKELSLEELDKTIARLIDKDSIVLKADQKSEFGIFVEIVDLLKMHHKEHVDIVVKKDK